MAKPKFNKTKTNYSKGLFIPENPLKYVGNPDEILYRSSWELKFMIYCDKTPRIKKWASENVGIPYYDEFGKIHRYFPDFYIEITYSDDLEREERVFIEIKPDKEIIPDFIDPVTGQLKPIKRKKTLKSNETYEYQLRTYAKNRMKWESAKEWCEKRHMKFFVIGESKLKESKIL